MDPRMFPARSGAVLKVRPGKSRSQRARHTGAKRRKKMSGPESSESRPSTSQESPTPSMSAVLAEEGVCVLLLGPGQNADGRRCHGWILRDLAMLGYIGKLQQFEQIIPLNSFVPYEVPFNAVALRVIHADVAPSHILYTANASWVGLCHILDDVGSQSSGPVILTQTPVCDCLGFGIIRGINMEKKVYHILTPIPPAALRLVNCLQIGNISIPHSIFKNQPGINGEIPYVTSDYDFTIYGSGKMKRKKHLKRREHL